MRKAGNWCSSVGEKPAPDAFGMPYHGLAVDREKTFAQGTDNEHTVRIHPSFGGSLLVRHPAAPGANRTPAQQAIDAALGYEWRDYALLTGFYRAFNGAHALGPNAWLYCAPNGTTWWLDLQYEFFGTGDNAYTRVSVVRKSLFGWFREDGDPIGPAEATAATLDHVPALPTGYSGPYTDAIYRRAIPLPGISVVPNEDGSEILVNMYKVGGDWLGDQVINSVYPLTKTGVTSYSLGQFTWRDALAGVLRVSCSGSPDPETGAGLVVSITVDSEYDDLVIKDNIIPKAEPTLPAYSSSCSSDFDLTIPPTEQEINDGKEVIVTFTCTWDQGSGSITTRQVGRDAEAVSFKHFDGAIKNKSYTDLWQEHSAATSGSAVWQERYQAEGNIYLGTERCVAGVGLANR